MVDTGRQSWELTADHIELDVIEGTGARCRPKRVDLTVAAEHARHTVAEVEHARQGVERQRGVWRALAFPHRHRVESGRFRPGRTGERDWLEGLIEFVLEGTVRPIEGVRRGPDTPVRMLRLLVIGPRRLRLGVHRSHLRTVASSSR